jgi:hypothetical protein
VNKCSHLPTTTVARPRCERCPIFRPDGPPRSAQRHDAPTRAGLQYGKIVRTCCWFSEHGRYHPHSSSRAGHRLTRLPVQPRQMLAHRRLADAELERGGRDRAGPDVRPQDLELTPVGRCRGGGEAALTRPPRTSRALWQSAVRVRPGAPSPYIVVGVGRTMVGEEWASFHAHQQLGDDTLADGHALHDVPEDGLLVLGCQRHPSVVIGGPVGPEGSRPSGPFDSLIRFGSRTGPPQPAHERRHGG